MKKKINIRQLQNLVEGAVRKYLNEDIVSSDELERGNPSDDERINQEMNRDWNELENINKRFQSQKNYPSFFRGYNSNIEDGRENAEAYAEGLFEAKIQRMVMEAINEVGDTERGQEKLGALSARKQNNGDFTKSAEVRGYADDARGKEWGKSKKDKEAMKRQKSLRNAFDDGYEKMYRK